MRGFGFPLALFGGAALLVGVSIYFGIQEQKAWDEFAKTHECKLVGHQNGYTTFGTGFANGKTVTVSQYHPSRNTYHCNDGVDYTR